MVLRSVGEQISDVAYLASDTCFFFPVVPEAPFGASLETIAADGRTNAYGRRCLVQRMNTYPDALDIAKPAGHSSAAVSALTLSQGLPMMLDNIRAAARTNQTFVIHCVAVKVAGNNFELVPDETATEQAIATGAAVVVAPSALSCYDGAIYAHALSRSLGKPVVHIIDGSLGLAGRTSASEPWDALAQRVRSVLASPSAVGRSSGAMQYHGSTSAHTVIVAAGAVVGAAKRFVATDSYGLGVVEVTALSPWDESSFSSVLPSGPRLIVVLGSSGSSHVLHQHVQAAVSRSGKHIESLCVECSVPEDTDVERLHQIVQSQGRSLPRGYGGRPTLLSSVTPVGVNLPISAAGTRQFKAWWSLDSETAHAQQLLVALSGLSGEQLGRHIDTASYHDVCNRKIGEGVTTTDILIASTPDARLSHRVCRADLAVVFQTAVLNEIDVFATLRSGGIALINCPQNYLGAHRTVPTYASEKQMQVYHVNSAEAGRICRISDDVAMCICAVYLAALQDGNGESAALRKTHGAYSSVPLPMVEYLLFSALMPFSTVKSMQGGDLDGPFIGCEPGSKDASISPCVVYTGRAALAQETLEPLEEEEVMSRALASNADNISYCHRPDLSDTIEFVVKNNVRLTSPSYYRDVFHVELQPRDPNYKLTYEPGMVLNIYPKNCPEKVQKLLQVLGLDGEQFFVRRFKTRAGQHMESVNTLRHYMTRVLDFWGCPKPSFYRSLIEYTDSPMTANLLAAYAENYEAAVDEALTYAEVLMRFKDSVKVPPAELVKGSMVPSVAARSYSIASCKDIVGNQIELVVVVETWQNKLGETKAGLCSSYLSSMRAPHPAQGESVDTQFFLHRLSGFLFASLLLRHAACFRA